MSDEGRMEQGCEVLLRIGVKCEVEGGYMSGDGVVEGEVLRCEV